MKSRLEGEGRGQSTRPSLPSSFSERESGTGSSILENLFAGQDIGENGEEREIQGGVGPGGRPLLFRLLADAAETLLDNLARNGTPSPAPRRGAPRLHHQQRQPFLAQSLHSAGSNQRHRRAALLKLCCFLGRGREGMGGSGSPGVPGWGRSSASPGQQGEEQEPWSRVRAPGNAV